MPPISPRVSFPRLLAGVNLKMQASKSSSEGQPTKEVKQVHMCLCTKSFRLHITFKDNNKALLVNPFGIQNCDSIESDKEDGSESSFVLKYGTQFVPSCLYFTLSNQTECQEIANEIRYLKTFVVAQPYNRKSEMNLHHIFDSSAVDGKLKLSSGIVEMCGKILGGNVKNYAGVENSRFTREQFLAFFRSVLNLNHEKCQSKALTSLFFKSCQGKDKTLGIIGKDSLEEFLEESQATEVTEDMNVGFEMQNYITRSSGLRASIQPHFSYEDFVDYLYSPDNDILDPLMAEVHQDMTQSLSRYFINSSHNTYLTGNQLTSDSSADAYAKVLLQGARCIEIDCWDGPDGAPIITHGRTMCSNIKLVDVIHSIKANAFVMSPYPVIISIEDHCSVAQQSAMAKMFRDILGDLLLTERVFETQTAGDFLPSPEELKFKILLKHKVLKDSPSRSVFFEDDDNASLTECRDDLLIKLSPEDPWRIAELCLSGNFLELSFLRGENDPNYLDMNTMSEATLAKEIVDIMDLNRDEAEELLWAQSSDPEDGRFLIRTKCGNRSTLVLSLHYNGVIWHTELKSQAGKIHMSGAEFASLKEFVKFFKTRQIQLTTASGKLEKVLLTSMVSKRALYIIQKWYIPNLPDDMIYRILVDKHQDGVFILRDGPEDVKVMSFTSSNTVFHVHIKQLEDFCEIGGVPSKHETILDLINHFTLNPIYMETKLTTPFPQAFTLTVFQVDHSRIQSRFLMGTELNLSPRVEDQLENSMESDDETSLDETITTKVFNLRECSILLDSSAIVPGAKDRAPYLKLTSKKSGESIFIKIDQKNEQFQVGWFSKLRQATEEGTSCPDGPRTDGENNAAENPKMKEAPLKISSDISNLTIYCKAVSLSRATLKKIIKFSIEDEPSHEMNSFNETKAKELMIDSKHRSAFQWRHKRQLCRIYPKGTRTNSSNFNPVPFWLCGCQMAALNFQTPDKELQINRGWFLQNGNCGYVLKPECMVEGCFDPDKAVHRMQSIELQISVLAGRQLADKSLKTSAMCNTFVKLEIIGCPVDSSSGTTAIAQANALNPSWDETFDFGIVYTPHLAVLRISAYNNNQLNNELLGQFVVPVSGLRKGYRSVTLKNGYNEYENGLMALLLHVEIRQVDLGESYLKKMIKNYKDLTAKCTEDGGSLDQEDYAKTEEAIEQLSRIMSRKTLPTADSGIGGGSRTISEDGSNAPRKLISSKFPLALGELSSHSKKKKKLNIL